MSTENVQTTTSLKEIFNLPDSQSETNTSLQVIEDSNNSIEKYRDIDNIEMVDSELKSLTIKAGQMLETAKYRLEQDPDAKTVDAVSKLLKSTLDIITELNKGILLQKEHDFKRELEMLRINSKKQMAELNNKKMPIPQISGDNNNITLQQTNIVSYCQEDIIKDLLKAKRERKIEEKLIVETKEVNKKQLPVSSTNSSSEDILDIPGVKIS